MISLTKDEHLILHSNILMKASAFFEALLRGQWPAEKLKGSDPKTGISITLWHYALLLVDEKDAYVLEPTDTMPFEADPTTKREAAW